MKLLFYSSLLLVLLSGFAFADTVPVGPVSISYDISGATFSGVDAFGIAVVGTVTINGSVAWTIINETDWYSETITSATFNSGTINFSYNGLNYTGSIINGSYYSNFFQDWNSQGVQNTSAFSVQFLFSGNGMVGTGSLDGNFWSRPPNPEELYGNLSLEMVSVPEPATLLMVLGGIAQLSCKVLKARPRAKRRIS